MKVVEVGRCVVMMWECSRYWLLFFSYYVKSAFGYM